MKPAGWCTTCSYRYAAHRRRAYLALITLCDWCADRLGDLADRLAVALLSAEGPRVHQGRSAPALEAFRQREAIGQPWERN
jgi:hypothetical protein